MELNNQTIKLICELEKIIGDECYNPASYNGWTGEEGKCFRYPVTFRIDPNSRDEHKTRGTVSSYTSNFNPILVTSMKYKCGANHIYIGLGIKKVLEELEKRYNINFNELENQQHSLK